MARVLVCDDAPDLRLLMALTLEGAGHEVVQAEGGAAVSPMLAERTDIDAIVLDVPESVAIARNEARPDRTFGSHVVTRQQRDLRKSMKRLRREGFRRVHTLDQAEIEVGVRIVREPSLRVVATPDPSA